MSGGSLGADAFTVLSLSPPLPFLAVFCFTKNFSVIFVGTQTRELHSSGVLSGICRERTGEVVIFSGDSGPCSRDSELGVLSPVVEPHGRGVPGVKADGRRECCHRGPGARAAGLGPVLPLSCEAFRNRIH